MFFSIIVPVYKVEKYLNRCVDSILKQSFRDFELILVDDGSPDRCGEICDRYAGSDSRVTVIHQENQGVQVARNAGLEKMGGRYVLLVDSDDWVEPNWLEELNKKLTEKPVDIVVIGYNVIYPNKIERHLFDDTLSLEQVKVKFLCAEWGGAPWIKCFRRELFEGVRFPKEVVGPDDLWVTGMLVVKIKSVGFIDKCLYNYSMLNAGSITNTGNACNIYWLAITLLNNNKLLKRAGLPGEQLSNYRVMAWASRALLADARDKVLTPRQVDELNAVINDLAETVGEMDVGAKFKAFHALSRWAWSQGNYIRALSYFGDYMVNKVKCYIKA